MRWTFKSDKWKYKIYYHAVIPDHVGCRLWMSEGGGGRGEGHRVKVRKGGERVRASHHALTAQHPQPCHSASASRAACVCWDKPEPSCLGCMGWSCSTRRQLSPATNPWRVVLTFTSSHAVFRCLVFTLPVFLKVSGFSLPLCLWYCLTLHIDFTD